MQTSKMYERISWYRKEYVHEQYSRIVRPFKDYERITKKKMLDSIYKNYGDYNNIIDICTTRELKLLKKIIDKKTDMQELLSDKYEWEKIQLRNKFLIQEDFERVFIPDEIIDIVGEAIKNVNWNTAKKLDDINEILVSYCKIQASALLNSVCSFGSSLTGIPEEKLWTHMIHNKVFNYYVFIHTKDFESLGKDIPVAICHDYYFIEEELADERKKQGLSGVMPVDIKLLKTLFYNDFDVNNKKIKKFLTEIKKLPFFWNDALEGVRESAVLNIDRTSLKQSFQNVPALKGYDLTNFFKVLDEAMDEMPSGALNGYTPNQAKMKKIEEEKIKYTKAKNYIKQQNAHLSKKDADLFYKIYFALLEFTNNKYEIEPHLNIYNKHRINPYLIKDIIEKFWENKDFLTLEFCMCNPYKFNKEELSLANEFKKGFRDIIVIARYEVEYTAVISNEKVYMIKGIKDNIDNIISYENLPTPIITSIIPFKNVLIYDGLLMGLGVELGNEFAKIVEKEYDKLVKYYHL